MCYGMKIAYKGKKAHLDNSLRWQAHHVPVHLWGLCLVAIIYPRINCAKSGSRVLGHTHLGHEQFSKV